MKNRILGQTGLSVSPICIGGWQLAGPLAFEGQPDGHPDPGKSTALRIIRTMGDAGINFIDTAEQYGNGESERRIGEAISGQRDKWIISTKFGYRVGPNGTRNDSSNPSTIAPSIEGSLKRLNTDYVDIYLYHCPPVADELEKGRAVLEQLVDEGKIRFYGISTNNIDLINRMIKSNMLHILQYHSNMLQDAAEIKSIIEKHNIGTQVRGVMAQGRLSGKYFSNQPEWAIDDNRSRTTRGDNYQRYAVLKDALPEGYTIAQVAIRWILDNPCNHSICMGAKTLEDYRAAIKASEMPPLTDNARAKLSKCAAAL